MRMEHPVDRFMRRIRPVLIGLIYVSGPVAVFASAKMLVLAMQTWSWPMFAIGATAQFIALLGAAALFDRRQE